MHIQIKSEKTRIEKTRKRTELHKQQAALDIGGDYPLPFEATVDEPYKPGRYIIDPLSFRVNLFGSLELTPYNFRLIPAN